MKKIKIKNKIKYFKAKKKKKGFNGDYGVKLTPNKLKVLCEVDWPTFV
jgi:hypothetical protein